VCSTPWYRVDPRDLGATHVWAAGQSAGEARRSGSISFDHHVPVPIGSWTAFTRAEPFRPAPITSKYEELESQGPTGEQLAIRDDWPSAIGH